MTSEGPSSKKIKKTILENSLFGSMVVPLAIILVGGLVIFGISKLLSTERSYKDLVREMQSKTFGNRWIAAYELSKVISRKDVPAEEVPWLIDNLSSLYKDSADHRTRDFIVVAVGALNHADSSPFLVEALDDTHKDVRFHAVVALGNSSVVPDSAWPKLAKFLKKDDNGLKQAIILAIAKHQASGYEKEVVQFLDHPSISLRYTAAMALIPFKNLRAVPIIQELLYLDEGVAHKGLRPSDILGLKLSALKAIEKSKWIEFSKDLDKLSKMKNTNIKIIEYSRRILSEK